MKRNLNSLKRLIAEFHSNKYPRPSKEARFHLLDEILFFQNKTEEVPFINEKTQHPELIKARSAQLRAARRIYAPGTTMIRARKLNAVLDNPTWQDFWEPPPQCTKRLRLNPSGEAVLYATCDTLTAKKETKIGANDIYNLSFYRIETPIEVTEFGFPLTGRQSIIERTIEKFLHGLMVTGGEAIYDLSNFIANRYFSLSEDGWVYPSIANNYLGENICLSIKSKRKLSLVGAFAFCNDAPIASYDLANHNSINTSTPEEAPQHWKDFTENSKVFGKITAAHNPTPIFRVKQIRQLHNRGQTSF